MPQIDDVDRALASGDEAPARLAGLCRLYRNEHAAVRFLVGVLRNEKEDAESRLRALGQAYEGRLAQDRGSATELAALRRECAGLRRRAQEKEAETARMVDSLQRQMMSGLAAAVERARSLQAELDAANAEVRRLEREGGRDRWEDEYEAAVGGEKRGEE